MSIRKMMNSANVLALAALTLMMVPTRSAHAAHGAGNGGDGLELSRTEALADVEVPVPGNMGRIGSLMVVGTPGQGQGDHVSLLVCVKTIDDLCHFTEIAGAPSLGSTVTLPLGTYLVLYSGTSKRVEVREGQKTVVELQKIRIRQGDRRVEFRVFTDFTDPATKEHYLKDEWSGLSHDNTFNRICNLHEPENEAACQAISSTDYHAILGTVVRITEDGSLSIWNFGTGLDSPTKFGFMRPERPYCTTAQSGDFVSVLPGVYGIEFRDPQTGMTMSTYGVRVD